MILSLVLPAHKALLVLKGRRAFPVLRASLVQWVRQAPPVLLVFKVFRGSRATRVIAATSVQPVPKASKASRVIAVMWVHKALLVKQAQPALLGPQVAPASGLLVQPVLLVLLVLLDRLDLLDLLACQLTNRR